MTNMPGAYARTATRRLPTSPILISRRSRILDSPKLCDANRLWSAASMSTRASYVQSRSGSAWSGIFSSTLTMTLEQQIHEIGAKARVAARSLAVLATEPECHPSCDGR